MTAVWVVVAVLATMWTVGPACYFLGHKFGHHAASSHWQHLLNEQDNELRAKNIELAQAEARIAELDRNIETAFGAGVMHGQLFRADREAEGL